MVSAGCAGAYRHPSSVPVFKSRLADRDPFLRRAAAEGLGASGRQVGDPGARRSARETTRRRWSARRWPSRSRSSAGNYIPRLVEFMDSEKDAPQIAGYLIELGPPIADTLSRTCRNPAPRSAPMSRRCSARSAATRRWPRSKPLTQDRDRDVARRPPRAIERIKMRCARLEAPQAQAQLPSMPSCRATSTRGRRSRSRGNSSARFSCTRRAPAPRPA